MSATLTEQIMVRFDKATMKRIEKEAAAESRTVANLVRLAVDEYLDRVSARRAS